MSDDFWRTYVSCLFAIVSFCSPLCAFSFLFDDDVPESVGMTKEEVEYMQKDSACADLRQEAVRRYQGRRYVIERRG